MRYKGIEINYQDRKENKINQDRMGNDKTRREYR